jgi:hypothetical protein
MLFHESKDESAWGLALVGFLIVTAAAVLGNVTGNVQPKAPVEIEHTDVSSPALREHVPQGNTNPETSPYPQPEIKH